MPPLLRQHRNTPPPPPTPVAASQDRVSKKKKEKEEAGRRRRRKMGQLASFIADRRSYKSYRHHLDPVALNRQTLEVREHMYGDCDVTLVVKEERFPVHRDILSEHSVFFRAMFGAFSERHQEEVELKELVEPSLMAQVIHYVYFKNVYLTPRNTQDLLGLAGYLQMPSLQRACSRYMQGLIDVRNCVALYLYTLHLGPYDLQCHAEDFILNHFEKAVAKSVEFADLTNEQLVRFLASERLVVNSEGAVYRAVMQWVGHDPTHRAPHLNRLLEYVHFPLMSINEVEQYRRDSRVKKTKNLAIAFEEAKRYAAADPREKIRYWSERRGDGRKPPRWPKILVVMRMYWKNLPMEYFDFRARQWSKLAEVQYWRSCAALVSFGSFVYLVGGEEKDSDSPTGSRTVNRVTKYDCEMRRWSSAQSMNLARRWGAAVGLGNTLYVIGGIGGRGGTYERRLDSMETLDLSDPRARWKLGQSMSTPRSSHTVEVLDGKIYVVGGGDGKEWFCSSEVYDQRKGKWSLISDMRTRRWKCGLCVLKGHLYAIGGMDSKTAGFWGRPLRSVERYFPATDEWAEVAPMATARFGCSCVAYQGKIYVSGGFGHGKESLTSVEVYDPEGDRWAPAPPMRKMCGFVGGVLVDRPISLDEKFKDE